MSATITLNAAPLENVVVDKKPRAPTLPAKYAKFIQFGFWFLKKLNENSDAPAIDEALFNEKLKLFAPIDQQQAFVQEFFDSSKDINKSIRDISLQRKRDEVKAEKAAARADKLAEKAASKAAAKAAAKVANAESTNNSDSDKKKTSRKKKEDNTENITPSKDTSVQQKKTKGKKKVLSSDDAFVNEMVQIANGQIDTPTPTVTLPLPVDVIAPLPLPVPVVPEINNSKPNKQKKVSKPKKNSNPDSTQVSILNLPDGRQFLLDDSNNLYHFTNHNLIGLYNPLDNSVSITEP